MHCTTYSLPFKFITSWWGVLAIFLSHFIIDRTNIIAYMLAIKNNVQKPNPLAHYVGEGAKVYDISNFGFAPERPFAISIWLYIICDNLCHIICNYFFIKYL